MHARPAAAALALALLALAGCAGKGGGTAAPGATAASGPPHAAGLLPPTLKVGDWWNFTAPTGALSYVISADAGDDYTMDTDNAGLAFFNALSDVSTLGPIRKADLAGSQGKDRVEFLQWPLRDGRNWTTTWDGAKVAITAQVSGEVAKMTAKRENGTLYAKYTYSNRTHWFTDLDFMDDAGNSAFELKLQASGSAFGGTVKRWDLTPVANLHGDLAAVPPPPPGSYQVPLTATDVYVSATLACTAGVVNVGTSPSPFVTGIAGADTRGGGVGGQPCPATASFAGSAGAPQAPPQGGASETWGYSVTAAPGSAGTYSLVVLVRTLHATPVA
jgi:hypothetical protein